MTADHVIGPRPSPGLTELIEETAGRPAGSSASTLERPTSAAHLQSTVPGAPVDHLEVSRPARAASPGAAPLVARRPLSGMTPHEIRALSGPLEAEPMARLATSLPWLSVEQIEQLRGRTDLETQSKGFARLVELQQEILEISSEPGIAYDRACALAQRVAFQRTLTPALTARLAAVLLTGTVSQHMKNQVDRVVSWLETGGGLLSAIPRGDLGALGALVSTQALGQLFAGDLIPVLPPANVEALKHLVFGMRVRRPEHRELFFRAFMYELAQIEPTLAERLVDTVGPTAALALAPSERGASSNAELAKALAEVDALRAYLAHQRTPVEPEAWIPSEAVKAAIASATAAISAADAFATTNDVSLASTPEILEAARDLYRTALGHVRDALTRDPQAVRHPDVKAWLARRARALFVLSAFKEAARGRDEPMPEKLVSTVAAQLGIRPAPTETRLEPATARALEAEVGGDIVEPTPENAARLVQALTARFLADPTLDPLVKVMLEPGKFETKHVHLILAPGIIPMPAIFDATLAQLTRDTGMKTSIAKTGLFDFTGKNAGAIENAMAGALLEDSEARFLLMGYSQGTANILTALDRMRTRSEGARAVTDRVLGVGSLFGAHNGSIVADDFVPELRAVLDRVPMGDRIQVGLSSLGPVIQLVAGGIQSMRRNTRRVFEAQADLPMDRPLFSITGHPRSEEEVPNVLRPNYRSVVAGAKARGLPTENDAQILAIDGQLGNEASPLGRTLRELGVELPVRMHHWGPLGPEHVPFIEDPIHFGAPKAAQVEVFVHLLGEHGLLSQPGPTPSR